jgi:hypothetical protein
MGLADDMGHPVGDPIGQGQNDRGPERMTDQNNSLVRRQLRSNVPLVLLRVEQTTTLLVHPHRCNVQPEK